MKPIAALLLFILWLSGCTQLALINKETAGAVLTPSIENISDPFIPAGSVFIFQELPETEKPFFIKQRPPMENVSKNQSSSFKKKPKEMPSLKLNQSPGLSSKKEFQVPIFSEKDETKQNAPLNEIIHNPVYSPNRKNFASFYQSSDSNDKYIIINNRFYGPFEEATFCGFNSDGSQFTFKFKKSGQWFLQTNENIFGPYQMGDPKNCYGMGLILFNN